MLQNLLSWWLLKISTFNWFHNFFWGAEDEGIAEVQVGARVLEEIILVHVLTPAPLLVPSLARPGYFAVLVFLVLFDIQI